MAGKNLALSTIVEKNKIASEVPFLVLLEIGVIDPSTNNLVETLYLVKNNEDITYQSQLYTAFPFGLSLREEAGAIPEVTITVTDYTRDIQARMQAYGGGINSTAKIIVVNYGDLTQPPEIVEEFKVVGASSTNYVVTWTLGAENPLSMPFPKRKQNRDRCAWKYKGTECGYGGPMASCDLTLNGTNGCLAHANEERYGGFPGINRGNIQFA